MNLLGKVLGLFLRFGYPVVFLGVMTESAGIPLPGETILLAAGFFASEGHFHLGWVILLAALGAILGDNLGYFLGARLARPFLARRGRFLLLTPPRLEAMEAFFARHGDKTILFARFISGLRVVAAIFAGLSRMRWRVFASYNAAGAFLWASSVGLLGFFFGQSWDLLEKWVGLGGLIALGVVAMALLLVTLLRHARALRTSVAALLPKALGRREGIVLLANLTALALFSKVIEDVVSGEATRFDRVFLAALHRLSGPLLNTLFLGGSALGSAPAIFLVVATLTWVCLRRGARREAQALVAATGMAEAVTLLLLYTVRRAHPNLWEILVHLHRYSFPSGHALVATAAYGMAAYLSGRLWPTFKRPAHVGAGLLILAIGLSRIALGANWPTDVLGGFAGGLLVLWATIYWYEGHHRVMLETFALMARREAGQGPAPNPDGFR
jgi:membrane protein DedA with SNARE-associated domain/membrane-associated phospholipid phosphatase